MLIRESTRDRKKDRTGKGESRESGRNCSISLVTRARLSRGKFVHFSFQNFIRSLKYLNIVSLLSFSTSSRKIPFNTNTHTRPPTHTQTLYSQLNYQPRRPIKIRKQGRWGRIKEESGERRKIVYQLSFILFLRRISMIHELRHSR